MSCKLLWIEKLREKIKSSKNSPYGLVMLRGIKKVVALKSLTMRERES